MDPNWDAQGRSSWAIPYRELLKLFQCPEICRRWRLPIKETSAASTFVPFLKGLDFRCRHSLNSLGLGWKLVTRCALWVPQRGPASLPVKDQQRPSPGPRQGSAPDRWLSMLWERCKGFILPCVCLVPWAMWHRPFRQWVMQKQNKWKRQISLHYNLAASLNLPQNTWKPWMSA